MMKRIVAMLLVLLLSISSVAFAEDIDLSKYSDTELKSLRTKIDIELNNRKNRKSDYAPASDFKYVSNGKEIQINGYKGKGGKVVMPSEIDGLPVTRIGDSAFENDSRITGIVLPEKLEYIGDSAFYNTEKLTGVVVFPNSVKQIGCYAFQRSGVSGIVILGDCKVKINALCNMYNLKFVYVAEGCSPHFSNASINCYDFNYITVNAIFPDTGLVIGDLNFTHSNCVRFYTPEGSNAAKFANKNFIECNTKDYDDKAAEYAAKYLGVAD